MRAIIELNNRLAALERRVAGGMRHGTVAEVNTGGGWVRLDLGPDGAGGKLLSPKIPYAQMAGALKVHAPPSVGQQMTVMAPTGDMSQGVAVPMTWSDQNAAPASGPDNALTFGDVRIDLTSETVKITIGGMTFEIDASGVKLIGDLEVEGNVAFRQGTVTHNEKNIGDTHVHGGVISGASTTSTPQ